MRAERRIIERPDSGIIPKRSGIVIVRDALAVVAEEAIEPLVERVARRAGSAEAPFAESAGDPAIRLKHTGQGNSGIGERPLTFGLHFAVVANLRVTGMFAGQENAAGRRADRTSGIMLCEPHSLSGQPVEIRSANFALAVRAEIAATQIIREEENNVWPARGAICRVQADEKAKQ